MSAKENTIGEVFVAVRPDTSDFASDTERAVKESRVSLKVPVAVDPAQARRAGEQAGQEAGEGASSKFKSAIAGIGGAIAAVGIAKFGSDAISAFKNAASSAIQLQKVVGGSVQDASRLGFELKETGVNAQTATTIFGRFEKGLVSTQGTTKGISGELQKLGISTKDAHGQLLPMNELLPKISDAFAKIPAGAEKAAAANTLFGKGGTQLLTFLNKGSEGLAELGKESDKYGDTVSGKGVQSLKDYNRAHKEVQAAQEGLKISIGQNLMPIIASLEQLLATKVLPVFEKVANFIERNSKVIIPLVATLGSVIAAFKLFTIVMAAFDAVADANPIVLIATAVIGLGIALIEAYKHSKTFREIVNTVFKDIKAVVMPIVDGIKTAFMFLWHNVLEPLGKFLGVVFKIYWDAIKIEFTVVKSVVVGLYDAFLWMWHNVLEPLGKFVAIIFKLYWIALRTEFRLMWQGVQDIISVFTWLWHNVLEPVGKFLTGVFLGAWNGIKTAIDNVVNAAKTTWSTLSDIFSKPINVVLGVVNKFDGFVDRILSDVGLGSIAKLPTDLHLATGGPVPGGYGGGDKVHALLEPGEFVLRKEAVKSLGLDSVHELNATQKFGLGGLVGDVIHPSRILKGAENLAGDVFDAGKWVLDKAQHLLRAGAADALDASYQNALKPVLGLLGSTLPGQYARGAVDNAEKGLVNWIRGKESSALTGTFLPSSGNASGPLQQAALKMLQAMGWGDQWDAFNAVVNRESSWNVYARNPDSGAYGIPQSLPAEKMASAGSDWQSNGITQLRWMMGYIKDVYGSPEGAWESEVQRGWYDHGGDLKPGWTLAYNGTGKNERVSTAEQSMGGGQLFGDVHIYEPSDADLVFSKAAFALKSGRA